MQRVVLGRTGLSASVLGLGGGGDSRLGRAQSRVTDARHERELRARSARSE